LTSDDFDRTPAPDYAKRLRLDDKVFVVFGAGAGMGRQTAHALAQAGAKVACVDRVKELADYVAGEVGGLAVVGDMIRREDAEAAFRQVDDAFGRLDGVADIIGMNPPVRFMDLRAEDWHAQLDVGLIHALHAIQIGGPLIARSGGGSITVTGSRAGLMASSGSAHYSATKAALHHLTRLAGVELAPSRVRVNCVVPGFTATPRLTRALGPEKFGEAAARLPLGRAAEPSDIAGAILFLASPLGGYITSQLLVVDGGSSVAPNGL
jgi:NAD(P)-dependent dehydrogenase (short-subunit alcohol dehydrogenase family)